MAVQRALLSVWDKSGLVDFARGLAELGVDLIASGGTARALREAGLSVTQVSDLTGFPEILGGRVKTLHPLVHGGILARRTPEHLSELAKHGILPIDLVVVNLYPFQETVAQPDVTDPEAMEQIDIGGVALLRAAAKNFGHGVIACCDPEDYAPILGWLRAGGEVPLEERRHLARKAFLHTSAYDNAIQAYLGQGEPLAPVPGMPDRIWLNLNRVQLLRYGENPHQQAAFYRWLGQEPAFQQLHGQEMSYNNWLDLDGAWNLAQEFEEPTVAIIKHTNPCGIASADILAKAYQCALACDPVSAFGSIIAVNRELDAATAEAMSDLFVEVVVAPSYSEEGLEILRRKKDLRLLRATGTTPFPFDPAQDKPLSLRTVYGGLLAQEPDAQFEEPSDWQVVTERKPTKEEMADLSFAWRVVKHVKSNAIVFVKGKATVGVGAGQMSRVDAVRLTAMKAGQRAQGAVMASDAFFPFPDGVEVAAAAGVTAFVQPGGSKRDAEVIAAVDRLGLAMCFTGARHFRH